MIRAWASLCVVGGQLGFEGLCIFTHCIEDRALAVYPTDFAGAEKTVEEAARDHLWWQGAIVASPAHVALDAFAKGFLRDANLSRAEAGVAADFAGDGLIDGCSACATAGEGGAAHQCTHRVVMAVAGAGEGGG
ncbi:MAG: hypothetical protein NTW74_24255 [Acidobacteria bacterium]|nr:hypothetical protein [Acidobacteriota bacterium]